MATLGAFNDMMAQFLSELQKTFPEEPAIKRYITSFELMKSTNPRKILDMFMMHVAPFQGQIMAKDEAFFRTKLDASDSNMIEELNIKKHWESVSANTKDAIWQYLQTLCMLGGTISSIPKETLSMIETMAEQCVGGMQAGEGGQLDQGNLMASLTGLMSSLGGAGGLPGLPGMPPQNNGK
jgi:hypothetical protein